MIPSRIRQRSKPPLNAWGVTKEDYELEGSPGSAKATPFTTPMALALPLELRCLNCSLMKTLLRCLNKAIITQVMG